MHPVTVIGAGLAGSEAAWQLACRGVPVRLFEMRPSPHAPAHHTDRFAELVCSNSLKSMDPVTAPGMLKHELATLGSVVLNAARATAVPAGAGLAVDRTVFSDAVTHLISVHPLVEVVREECVTIPEYGEVIVATGPLTSPRMHEALSNLVGDERLSFFDAAAPIVDASSVDRSVVFAASRYGKGAGDDYLNCPFERDEYEQFVAELVAAERAVLKDFETADLFQACQPVEEVARRGPDALRYGAMKPVGLTDPRTGRRPWAVLQLRAENAQHAAYNLVGCQTNLTFPEQRRVFALVPGLSEATFFRYGVMHRNTFIDAPRVLHPDLRVRRDSRISIAGQLTGTEGYLEAAATGLVASLAVAARHLGHPFEPLPATTTLGALLTYATDPATAAYQPMHVNLGLLPLLDPPVTSKRDRHRALADRARTAIDEYAERHAALLRPAHDALAGVPSLTGEQGL